MKINASTVPNCSIFLFQAEDGIRDYKVTGVQTCALPIWHGHVLQSLRRAGDAGQSDARHPAHGRTVCRRRASKRCFKCRSEERRVGKECGHRWALDALKKHALKEIRDNWLSLRFVVSAVI